MAHVCIATAESSLHVSKGVNNKVAVVHEIGRGGLAANSQVWCSWAIGTCRSAREFLLNGADRWSRPPRSQLPFQVMTKPVNEPNPHPAPCIPIHAGGQVWGGSGVGSKPHAWWLSVEPRALPDFQSLDCCLKAFSHCSISCPEKAWVTWLLKIACCHHVSLRRQSSCTRLER